MGTRELGHIYLFVSDLEKSREFYRDVVGLTEIPIEQALRFKQAIFIGGTGRTHHELFLAEVEDPNPTPVPAAPRLGLNHFGIKVGETREELLAVFRAAKRLGARTIAASDHGHTHSLHLLDPDGVQVEVYVDLEGVFWKDDPGSLVTPEKSQDEPLPLDGETLPQQSTYDLIKAREKV